MCGHGVPGIGAGRSMVKYRKLRKREGIPLERSGLCGVGRQGQGKHCTQLWDTPCSFLWIHTWPQNSWPLSNPPELLAEKMESQRKEHRPWAAALAVLQRASSYLKSNCSTFPCLHPGIPVYKHFVAKMHSKSKTGGGGGRANANAIFQNAAEFVFLRGGGR